MESDALLADSAMKTNCGFLTHYTGRSSILFWTRKDRNVFLVVMCRFLQTDGTITNVCRRRIILWNAFDCAPQRTFFYVWIAPDSGLDNIWKSLKNSYEKKYFQKYLWYSRKYPQNATKSWCKHLPGQATGIWSQRLRRHKRHFQTPVLSSFKYFPFLIDLKGSDIVPEY